MPLIIPHPDATALDTLRAGLVLLFAILQAVMAFWPDLRGWRDTISTRSASLSNPVVPVPPTFAIWGLIFLSLWRVWGLADVAGELGRPAAAAGRVGRARTLRRQRPMGGLGAPARPRLDERGDHRR